VNPKHRVFWEWLADQYEVWADDPPKFRGMEEHTCHWLECHFGFRFWANACEHLVDIWSFRYGQTMDPAGLVGDEDRDAQRHEFCWWMADTIREYLDTGKGPWATD